MQFMKNRSCFRCGKEFSSDNGDGTCSNCGRPKALPRTVLEANLSLRQKQVVALVCKAKQNKEIAYELNLTEGTVKEYLNRIFRKLGVSNRTELAIWVLTQQPARVLHEYAT